MAAWLPRRLYRMSYLRIPISLILVWSILDTYAVYHAYSRTTKAEILNTGRIFIAGIHWNNEAMLRNHWNGAVLDLIKAYPRNDTFLSVQESGSWDDTKAALRELDQKLEPGNYRRRIVLDNTTHFDEVSRAPAASGWVDTPRGRKELRRIPYLSRLRNLVLEPLLELAAAGEKFDKIIFLNDVIFNNQDIAKLLNTRGGNYAAACAMDFSKPPGFYDTFVLGDSQGNNNLMETWPYFRSAESRRAIKANKPVPVASCWNGIAVMDAAPFYDISSPLRFRGVPDSLAELHIEGSECCLIHIDNPISSKGIWLNPEVRVAYSDEADAMIHPAYSTWLSFENMYWSLWKNRFLRWFTTSYFTDAVVQRRINQWMSRSSSHTEPGTACLVNEMQILVENGWTHV